MEKLMFAMQLTLLFLVLAQVSAFWCALAHEIAQRKVKNKNKISFWQNDKLSKTKNKKESADERRLRLELENIDAFYTSKAQKEVE